MIINPPYRKGWCPGALRPMESGDGLLARVRAAGGRLTLDQTEALGACAASCGNGLIGLSARANLQLRGVFEASLPELQARLRAIGLIDDEPEVERLRNVVASPGSDCDPDAAFDCAPLVAAIEREFARDNGLHDLPAKFGLVVDAGGRLGLGQVDGDIRFEAGAQGRGDRLAVALGGDGDFVAHCLPDEIGATAARLAKAFLHLRGAGPEAPRRMRGLAARLGAPAIFARAGLAASPRLGSPRIAATADYLGAHNLGRSAFVGAAAPFGQLEAGQLRGFASLARDAGALGIRLTPWRAVLAVGVDPVRAAPLAQDLSKLGFIVDSGDRRLNAAACPGAPACSHAAGSTQREAAQWAALLAEDAGIALHVSGCEKGCAHPAKAAWTVVAREGGYDVVANGRTTDRPVHRDLSGEGVADLLRAARGEECVERRPAR